jgi:hypothetical protein
MMKGMADQVYESRRRAERAFQRQPRHRGACRRRCPGQCDREELQRRDHPSQHRGFQITPQSKSVIAAARPANARFLRDEARDRHALDGAHQTMTVIVITM